MTFTQQIITDERHTPMCVITNCFFENKPDTFAHLVKSAMDTFYPNENYNMEIVKRNFRDCPVVALHRVIMEDSDMEKWANIEETLRKLRNDAECIMSHILEIEQHIEFFNLYNKGL